MIGTEIVAASRAAPYLRADDERDLLVKAQSGCAASRDALVRSHLRLAISTAAKYRGYHMDPEDLTQEACVGLVRAIDSFDLDQPVRFGTYAMWHIRSGLTLAAMNAPTIRGGSTVKQKAMFFKLRRHRLQLERQGLAPRDVNVELARIFDVPVEDIEAATARMDGNITSLQTPIGDGGDDLGTLIPDDRALPDELLEDAMETRHRAQMIARGFEALNAREAEIIRARLLVDDDEKVGLEELGVRFGISKERVRQIEARALEKMRDAIEGRATREAIRIVAMSDSPARGNERDLAICKMYADGAGLRPVGAAFGMTPAGVAYVLQKCGQAIRPRGRCRQAA